MAERAPAELITRGGGDWTSSHEGSESPGPGSVWGDNPSVQSSPDWDPETLGGADLVVLGG
jgi:hypothetical protein